MLLVLPYCQRDFGLARKLLEHIKPLGPYDKHQLLLAYPKDYKSLLEQAKVCSFSEVRVLEIPTPAEGWPAGPNTMFVAVAKALKETKEPWYFFEPDSTPTRPGWLDRLEAVYFEAHRPFMGAVVPTRVLRNGEEITDGEHMVGAGIYPANAADRIMLFPTIEHSHAPWDVYLQWEILPQCHKTIYIQHLWNTKQAKRVKGRITVKPGNDVALAGTVDPEALVVHGIKDGSLMELLREEQQEAA